MSEIMEIWKEIDGFQRYWVSNYGQVKSIKPSGDLILKQVIKYSRQDNKRQNKPNTGYYRVPIRVNGKRKYLRVHILVAKAFVPNPENKPIVNHKDTNKLNNHWTNLEWTTHQENVDHAGENGLRPIGSKNGSSKLKEEQVIEIKRLLLTTDLLYKEIAKMYNVNVSLISNIKLGRAWKHIIIAP